MHLHARLVHATSIQKSNWATGDHYKKQITGPPSTNICPQEAPTERKNNFPTIFTFQPFSGYVCLYMQLYSYLCIPSILEQTTCPCHHLNQSWRNHQGRGLHQM